MRQVDETIKFYSKFFGAHPIEFMDKEPALFTGRSFILLNSVDSEPANHLQTCLWHIGWAGVDGPSEFEWRKQAGVGIHTPITAIGEDHFMYFKGPTQETIEVYTGSRNHRFEHIHLLASDVNQTIDWFVKHLGLAPGRKHVPRPAKDTDPNSLRGIWMNTIQIGSVNLIVFGKPRPGTDPFWAPKELPVQFKPTKGSTIDHLGFSYRNIGPEFERIKNLGADIQSDLSVDPTTGMKHFFVLAPDQLLIEIVEARPVPEGVWEKR